MKKIKNLIKLIDPFIIILFVLSICIGLFISLTGKPYVLHPDEIFILKRPFKRVLEYVQMDFSSQFSLYDLCLLIWFSIYFVIGKIIGLFSSFTDFKEQIILEKFHIIYWGRMLSVIFIALANTSLFLFIKNLFSNIYLQILCLFIILFNPVLIPSVFWLKYDALIFLLMSILMPLCLKYIYHKEYKYRNYIYFLLFVTLSVRIEIILFMVIFTIYDIYLHKVNKNVFFEISFIKIIGLGIVIYSLLTLHPISFLFNKLDIQTTNKNLLTSHGYNSSISNRIMAQIKHNFLATFPTFFYYLKVIFLLVGPVFVFLFIKKVYNNFQENIIFIIYILGFITIITLFNHQTVHYTLSFISLFLLIPLIEISTKSQKTQSIILVFQVLYVSTITLPFIINNSSHIDPRFSSKQYLLENTTSEDLIAIETISMHGHYPVIEETSHRITQKSDIYQQNFKQENIGLSIKKKEKKDTANCRKILDVFTTNYLSQNIQSSNDFINTFDTLHLLKKEPKYFVSYRLGKEPFHQFLFRNYTLVKTFEPYKFMDVRCNLLYTYKPSIFVLKNKKALR